MSKEATIRDKGFVFVISGPSGSGKTTLLSKLLKDAALKGKLVKSVSLTTRLKRRGEKSGRDYRFVSSGKFQELLRDKKILEWTRYLGYYYATPKDFIEKTLQKGRHIGLCLDINGAVSLKKFFPKAAKTIFVKSPTLKELEFRIRKRSRETSEEEICARLKIAKKELARAGTFDFVVVNDALDKAVEKLKTFVLKTIQ